MADQWTVLKILRRTTDHFAAKDVSEPRLSAEHLLADVLGCRRLDLYLDYDRPLTEAEISEYRDRVRRRMASEPIQYITGTTGFRGLDLKVDRRVLVPRPETEQLVGEVLAWVEAERESGRVPKGGWRVLDLGTGSGAIACSLAVELDDVHWILGVDRSVDALEVARANARRLQSTRNLWMAADIFSAVRPRTQFDAIVSNPPYIADGDASLPREVVDWEPPEALFGGPRGDEVVSRIVDHAGRWLRPGGLLALELGEGQAGAVRERIDGVEGLEYLTTFRDYTGIQRGVLALGSRK